MREMDKDERLLCELQGKIFERSAEEYGTSSAVFVRRYMKSDYAARMDREGFVDRPTDAEEAYEALDTQYGKSDYGSEKYPSDELFWMGYIYRYWAIAFEMSSKAVYRICNVSDMHYAYYAYHTLDPLAAVQRLMEAKGRPVNEKGQIEAAVKILRQLRSKDSGLLHRSLKERAAEYDGKRNLADEIDWGEPVGGV